MSEIQLQESEALRLAAEGDTKSAINILVSLVKECVEKKNFARAEAIREKIFETFWREVPHMELVYPDKKRRTWNR